MLFEKIPTSSFPSTRQEFEQLFESTGRRMPVLFRGAALDWPAISWTPEYFRIYYGQLPVYIQTRERLTMQKTGGVQTEYHRTLLGEYINSLGNNPETCGYLTQTNLLELAPMLRIGCKFPPFQPVSLLSRTNVWLGPQGTKSKLHYDSDYNLFVQLYGKKIITLIDPRDSSACYPTNVTWYDGYSPIDVTDPDFRVYPRFRDVTLFQETLSPGDMLFIPKRWWHDIRSLETSISVNLWWTTLSGFVHELIQEITHWMGCPLNKQIAVDRKNSYLYSVKQNILSLFWEAVRRPVSVR